MSVIVTTTATAGSGKSTIIGELLRRYPDSALIPSYTTREPCTGDLPGEYDHTKKRHELEDMNARGEFEWLEPVGADLYGTRKEDLRAALASSASFRYMSLVPESLRKLDLFLEQESSQAFWIPFFIKRPPESVILARVTPERFNQIISRWPREREWEMLAMELVPGIISINNDRTMRETLNQIIPHLS